jgi:hypothetical protein
MDYTDCYEYVTAVLENTALPINQENNGLDREQRLQLIACLSLNRDELRKATECIKEQKLDSTEKEAFATLQGLELQLLERRKEILKATEQLLSGLGDE